MRGQGGGRMKSVQDLIDEKVIEAIGWAYADCFVMLDKGLDPREAELPEVLERARKDLELGDETVCSSS